MAERRSPALRAAGLEQRRRGLAAFPLGLGIAAREQHAGPAVDDGLGRAHAHDDVCVDELACDPLLAAVLAGDLHEVRIFGVVHLHLAVERARERRREEPVELSAPRPPAEAGGDEDRLPLVGDAEVAKLLNCGADCCPPRVHRSTGQRQRRHVGHDRRPSAPRHHAGQRHPGEREANGVAHRRADVGDRLARGLGRHEHDGVVGRRRRRRAAFRRGAGRAQPHTRLEA